MRVKQLEETKGFSGSNLPYIGGDNVPFQSVSSWPLFTGDAASWSGGWVQVCTPHLVMIHQHCICHLGTFLV